MADRCGPPRDPMHSGELIARLYEIGDATKRRAEKIKELAAERGTERRMLEIGAKALGDDGVLLHALAEAMEELTDSDPTFLAVLMPPVDAKYEERRRP